MRMSCASSPYARRGALWTAHRQHFAKDGPILVWQADTRTMNPTVPQRVIDEAMERDPASASSEYGAQFRSDIADFVSREAVEACVGDYFERAPLTDHQPYFAFCDPSGGSSDSFTCAIGHREDNHIIIDAVREMRPPFSPDAVIDEFAALIRSYGIARVCGDKYAGEFPRELFRKNGIFYVPAAAPKSDLYRDLLSILTRPHRPPAQRPPRAPTLWSSSAAPRAWQRHNRPLPRSTRRLRELRWPVVPISSPSQSAAHPGCSADHVASQACRPFVALRQRIEEEMRQAVPICTIDFNLPKNQWRDLQ